MPQLLGSFGQRARIQNEPAEFLYYTAGLAGTIEIGIDNSISRAFHNDFDYMSEARLWIVKSCKQKKAGVDKTPAFVRQLII